MRPRQPLDGSDPAGFEDDMIIESFLVRLWIDQPISDEFDPSWRGNIIHVSDGTRMRIDNLGQICHFIASYLDALGVHSDLRTKLIRRLFPLNAGTRR